MASEQAIYHQKLKLLNTQHFNNISNAKKNELTYHFAQTSKTPI